MGYPHVPSAIRSLLLADSQFNTSCAGRCSTRTPADVTKPYAIVQLAGSIPIDGRGWAWSPLVQVNAWSPNVGADDPEQVVWRIANHAARILGAARAITYTDSDGSMTYTARITDGPMSQVDTSRGTATPLYGCLVRAELRLQHT